MSSGRCAGPDCIYVTLAGQPVIGSILALDSPPLATGAASGWDLPLFRPKGRTSLEMTRAERRERAFAWDMASITDFDPDAFSPVPAPGATTGESKEAPPDRKSKVHPGERKDRPFPAPALPAAPAERSVQAVLEGSQIYFSHWRVDKVAGKHFHGATDATRCLMKEAVGTFTVLDPEDPTGIRRVPTRCFDICTERVTFPDGTRGHNILSVYPENPNKF
jgi:hypothetical protein